MYKQISTHTYIYGVDEVQMLWDQVACVCAILVLRECIWNERSCLSSQALAIPLPWVILCVGWSIFLVSYWVTIPCFFAGNRKSESEVKPPTFFSLLLFLVFLVFLF